MKRMRYFQGKIVRPSAYSIPMMMQRERITDTVAFDKVNPNTSIMYCPYAHVNEYKPYWLSMSIVFTLKDFLGMSIFVFGGNKKRKNGALNVVDVAISS